ncbi:MAG: alpha/beta hydrolase [Betaproteobacteria bacterium RIFCSPLOWO2_02_FULL_65_24]|nr:MAG: alpha/beta hydrolase [Betaproteobacteria bacterium RIFCSPLOWO2_02_FULL_65_24]OGA95084.1 MAG: alpha/beta hydrolase [Betaproteobacteria bacterium RIFCSPLOWO2_12_FULL_66_14]
MSRAGERVLIPAAAGTLEMLVERPGVPPRGVALIAHPHPLFGGTLENKVVQTLARTFHELGYVALRPNFRGVGASSGVHDCGEGETEDMLQAAAWAHQELGRCPTVLAGFSFGAYVQTRVAKRLSAERLVLVGLAAGQVAGERNYAPEEVPPDTLVIHGERDETVALQSVFDWARPQGLPVVVIPGADHFFHRRLHIIRSIVKGSWKS